MIFTATRELLLNRPSAFLLGRGKGPPGHAMDLINVGVPGFRQYDIKRFYGEEHTMSQ